MFTYSYTDEYGLFVAPYERDDAPDQPLHIDQLPPHLRERYGRCRFDTVSFAEAEHVQPWEFGECVGWDAAGAYLTADYKSVRPIPNSEVDFHDLALEAKRHLPPELKNVRFEEPEEPKPKPRRKKKGGADGA
jgi:hypothetical protein